MNLKRYAFMVTAAATGYMQANSTPFEDMHKSMQAIQQEMGNMFENMHKMHEQLYSSFSQTSSFKSSEQGINIAINDEEQSNSVKIIISGVVADSFDAHFSDKELTIKAPNSTVTLNTHHNVLGAGVTQELKEDSTDDDKTQASFFTSSSHIHQMISKPIDLEKAVIEYNKEKKSLTVEIPYKDNKKQGKTIPVNIRS